MEALSREELEELAALYDRFAHALDPFAPERDEVEAQFHRRLTALHEALASATEVREFRREAIRACKASLRKNP